MGVKIRYKGIRIDESLIHKITDEFHKTMLGSRGDLVRDAILGMIKKGLSPVKGYGRFVGYSDSYLKSIKSGYIENKQKRPVNLTVTGNMLRSFFIRKSSLGLFIGFKSELAAYHNDLGASTSHVIRKMLPTFHDEKFSKVVDDRIKDALKLSIDRVKKK
jgi:hypothetical protein